MPTISIICSSCGSKLRANDNLIGRTLKCPKCKNPVVVTGTRNPPAQASGPKPTTSSNDEDLAAAVLANLPDPPSRLPGPSLPEQDEGTTPKQRPADVEVPLVRQQPPSSDSPLPVGMPPATRQQPRRSVIVWVVGGGAGLLLLTAAVFWAGRAWQHNEKARPVAANQPVAIPPPPADANNPADAEAKKQAERLLEAAQQAIYGKNTAAAKNLLEKYIANPHASMIDKATRLLGEIEVATSDQRAMTFLQSLSDADLERVSENPPTGFVDFGEPKRVRQQVEDNVREYTLQHVYRETLFRNAQKEKARRTGRSTIRPADPLPLAPPSDALPPTAFLRKRTQDSQAAWDALQKTFEVAEKTGEKDALLIAYKFWLDVNKEASRRTLTRATAFQLSENYIRLGGSRESLQAVLLVGAAYIPPGSTMTLKEAQQEFARRINEKR